jgi:hypothetical protein
MLRIAIITLSLAVCSGSAFVEKAKAENTKHGRSYEECKKLIKGFGDKGAGARNRNAANPYNQNAQGRMARCMRGEEY